MSTLGYPHPAHPALTELTVSVKHTVISAGQTFAWANIIAIFSAPTCTGTRGTHNVNVSKVIVDVPSNSCKKKSILVSQFPANHL
jgi:hypothetical protein